MSLFGQNYRIAVFLLTNYYGKIAFYSKKILKKSILSDKFYLKHEKSEGLNKWLGTINFGKR